MESYEESLKNLLKINNDIFIRARAFVDKQYPDLASADKIIPIAILSNTMCSSLWGAFFHSRLAEMQQQGASNMVAGLLGKMGVK